MKKCFPSAIFTPMRNLFCIFGFLSSALTLPAATILFDSALPTGTNVLLSNPTVGTSGITIQNNTTLDRQAGFSFSLISTASLSEVSVLVGSGWASTILGKQLTLEVVTLASLASAPTYATNPGTILLTNSTTLPSSTSFTTSDAFYLDFTLSAPLTLSANQAYAVIFQFDPSSTNRTNGMSLRFSNTKGTSQVGYSFSSDNNGSTFTGQGSSSAMVFALSTSAIPEPSIAYLLITGSAAFGLVTYVRRKAVVSPKKN